MDIYVLNSSLERVDLIDDYESVIWNIKYFDVSDFELYVYATTKNVTLCQRGNYLVRDKDIRDGNMYSVMRIDNIEITTDIENGDHLIVTGKDLRSITSQRIVWSQTNLSSKVEFAMRRLLTENIIDPTDTDRAISNMVLGEYKDYPEIMRKQVTGDNLQDTIVTALTAYGIGWDAYVNSDSQIVFIFYKGVDRSVNQYRYPHIIFSPDNENILNSDYKMDYSNYKNVALVAGEGEGTARKKATVGAGEGINRYEIYIDARDVSSNEGEISEPDYLDMLAETGSEQLEEYKYAELFEGEIDPHANYEYGTDYKLGDTVTVKNMYGVMASPRIIGVIESYSNEGESVIPMFSTWIGDDE